MLYSVFSYNDGTEVTASTPDKNGNFLLHIERFDISKDEFIHVTFVFPNISLKSSHGYNEQEIENMKKFYSEIQADIVDFITEKVKKVPDNQ